MLWGWGMPVKNIQNLCSKTKGSFVGESGSQLRRLHFTMGVLRPKVTSERPFSKHWQLLGVPEASCRSRVEGRACCLLIEEGFQKRSARLIFYKDPPTFLMSLFT